MYLLKMSFFMLHLFLKTPKISRVLMQMPELLLMREATLCNALDICYILARMSTLNTVSWDDITL
jgi:hypothetical protein